MLVLLLESLRQGTEVDTPRDVRATALSNKSSSHILSLSLLKTRGETECFESSPKVQEEKLKVQTVPPRPGAVPCDPHTGTNDFPVTNMLLSAGIQRRGQEERGGSAYPRHKLLICFDYLIELTG